jgi:hypothetical protein
MRQAQIGLQSDHRESRLKQREGWLEAQVDDELVMMSAQDGLYLGLSVSAARIWRLLETFRTPGEVCDLLAHEYEVPVDRLRSDVADLVDTLVKHGALEREACQPEHCSDRTTGE